MLITSITPFILFLFVHSDNAASIFENKPKTCGYDACPPVSKTKLNVHLVAHSHDDLGWLNTVNQYYEYDVNNILTTSVEELLKNPERRFVYSEVGFFWLWWKNQNETTREDVRNLVSEGRLEFINGGWSMPDEAVTHYHSLIDQYTWGFRRLNDTFGSCGRSRVGWQIDPFGHSREVASMFAQFGFDGLFFARLDKQDKRHRMKTKTAEFVWNASPSLGDDNYLFTSLLYNHYNSPPGLCFDNRCGNYVSKSNGKEMGKRALNFAKIQAEHYTTNNILFTMGDDFHYTEASSWFNGLDNLIRYTNKYYGDKVNLIYSTPSCYLKAVNEHELTYTSKSDDFFPYSDSHGYWTGYFTSRPTIKLFERFGNNFMQAAKQLSSLTSIRSYEEPLENLREIMGVLQHHDAVTGTEKEFVAHDYAKNLHNSIKEVEPLLFDSLKKLMINKPGYGDLNMHTCLLLNTSSCEYSENYSNFVLTLYNPTSRVVSPYVRLPVNGTAYKVQNHEGHEMVTQVVPILDAVKNLPGRQGTTLYELVFKAANVPAFGFQSFYVSEDKAKNSHFKQWVDIAEYVDDAASWNLGDKDYKISVDYEKNIIASPFDNEDLKVRQGFEYYDSRFGFHGSGAYIFSATVLNQYQGKPRVYRKIQGKVVNELHINISREVSEVIRTYNGEDYVEYDWVVGPLDDKSNSNEVITKFKTDIKNNGIFYTDSNGRSMLERKLNYRPTWNLTVDEPVSGNYYPVTSKIYIKDEEQGLRLAVLTDRSQGGSSLHDGEIELMVHRRTGFDDGLGVGESLEEYAFGQPLVVRGQHRVVATRNKLEKQLLLEKSLASEMAYKPLYFFTPVDGISFEQWRKTYNMQGAGISVNLPPNVQILTLEPWKDDTILLRLEHLFEKGESEKYSKPVTVNIKELFTTFTVRSVEETSLGANMKIDELHRLKWKRVTDASLKSLEGDNNDEFNIVLHPMEIRTFVVKVSYKKVQRD